MVAGAGHINAVKTQVGIREETMALTFQKATKKQAKLRLALHGPSGAGKSFSTLSIGRALVGPTGRVALLDTERGSAAKYSDKFDFDTCEVTDNYHPDRLIEAIDGAAEAGYDLLGVDSMTHFWNGPGGFLELVDEEVKRQKARGHKPDSFAAWKTVDMIYKRMVQKILGAPIHIIMTMRAKQEYVKEADDRGKTTIRKVGMAPEMRDNFQYEADIEGMLDIEHNLVIGKTRCDALDGKVFTKPGKDIAAILRTWLEDGESPAPPQPAPEPVDYESIGVELEQKVNAAETASEIAALRNEYRPKFKGAPKSVTERAKSLLDNASSRLTAPAAE